MQTILGSYGTSIPRHKVFVSYHHANDEQYKATFIRHFSQVFDGFQSQSVEIGDINPYNTVDSIRNRIRDDHIRRATVTIVLIGTETWKRKHVDWEISGSIRRTKLNSRCGLIGIVLPTHPSYMQKTYEEGIVPPRLVRNQKRGFANIYHWTDNAHDLKRWIHEAYERRTKIEPDNSYPHFVNNKWGERWTS